MFCNTSAMVCRCILCLLCALKALALLFVFWYELDYTLSEKSAHAVLHGTGQELSTKATHSNGPA